MANNNDLKKKIEGKWEQKKGKAKRKSGDWRDKAEGLWDQTKGKVKEKTANTDKE
jgi:uncharacterized protein YjbJ (UPF0337 family)